MCGSDIFLGFLAILFPPIAATAAAWTKQGATLQDSVADIALQYGSSAASVQPTLSSTSPFAAWVSCLPPSFAAPLAVKPRDRNPSNTVKISRCLVLQSMMLQTLLPTPRLSRATTRSSHTTRLSPACHSAIHFLDHTLSVFSNSCVLGASLKASSWSLPSRGASGSSANAPAVPASPVSLPSSLLPIMTLPATNMAAPSNQRPGRVSEKIKTPRTAVIIKLADVLMTLTLVVLEARVRARVKSPHMIPLKTRDRDIHHEREIQRTCLDLTIQRRETKIQPMLWSGVLYLAKTPFKAAHAPLATAKSNHLFVDVDMVDMR
ncbi:hypothetical protein KCU77_g72, partial [Aureobasidium melanogenum]